MGSLQKSSLIPRPGGWEGGRSEEGGRGKGEGGREEGERGRRGVGYFHGTAAVHFSYLPMRAC